ncbi:DUF1534 domain-containing protein [Pseudomonas syringae]|nr:DUF1534 domain-containing protein [Pseudomonas syringae]MCF5739255.1 DUF1534 domain-containing protein [Pseudomonas syringae]MCF5752848.1 DUF1534 domain-containing protein [Pseudomonas syringae]MCF5754946.1 DUF1534 domain-containing protein [Pseudomonas syringae]
MRLSFRTLQRGNAGLDALRRTIIEVSVQTVNQAVCASIFWRRLRGRMSVQTSSM